MKMEKYFSILVMQNNLKYMKLMKKIVNEKIINTNGSGHNRKQDCTIRDCNKDKDGCAGNK